MSRSARPRASSRFRVRSLAGERYSVLRTHQTSMPRVIGFLTFAAILGGCGSDATRNDQSDARPSVVVRRIIPAGTALDEAEERLADEGFRCESLDTTPLDAPGPVTHQLHCERLGTEARPHASPLRVTLEHAQERITS